MVVVEDSFYKAIITGYLESLCNSIYSSNILQDFITKLSEAQGFYAIDDKIQGLRDIVLSNLNYLLSLKNNPCERSSDTQKIISDESFITPFIIELRGLTDNFLRQNLYLDNLGYIPPPFEDVLIGLSEILNIKIFLFDTNACTYSQYGSSKFNLILYYHNNKESLDRLYLNYEHPYSSVQVSHSVLDKYRCNLCNLLPHESVLSLEDTCYCSNCLGYLVSKGMLSCNICTKRYSSLTIRTIKKKRYICSGCQSEYNYLNFAAKIECTHGLCKACTMSSMKQAACKGCSRILRPEEVDLRVKCEVCGENKAAENFNIEKLCKCDICDDCVIEIRKIGVKCRICNQYLYDREVGKCFKCGIIDEYENGIMQRCSNFLCKDCSKNVVNSAIHNPSIRPTYSYMVDHEKNPIITHDKLQPKAQEEDKEYECGICRVPYKKDSTRILLCDHSFCDDCLVTYILYWLDNTSKPRAAPCPKCPMDISPVIIQAVMPTTEYDIYNRTCFNASNNRCLKCRTVFTISDNIAYCSSCDVWLCKICLQYFHEGDCDSRFSIELKPISHRNKRSFICPNPDCKHEYSDSYMRDKAVCMKCLTKFCLKCSRLYNPIQVHGHHFHSSKCTRYKSTYEQDKFDPACINCREEGSLCAMRTTQP
jgi:hypothetical protein